MQCFLFFEIFCDDGGVFTSMMDREAEVRGLEDIIHVLASKFLEGFSDRLEGFFPVFFRGEEVEFRVI